jgi:glycosyltransferase involved in cell wall biosynthesis
MRIAVVNSLRVSGGGEKWAVRLAPCWQERGHQVCILCQPGSGLEKLAQAAGLDAVPTVMRHDLSLPGVFAIATQLRRFRPDLVLCCNERAYRLTVPASLLAGRPPLVYRNGLSATFKNRSINRWLFGPVRRMVVNSRELREEMAGYGWIAPERLRIIRNGIDTSLYRRDDGARAKIRQEFGTPGEVPVAAVIARLTEDKGQAETLRAFAAATQTQPSAALWLAGEGNPAEFKALAGELGIGERVRFLGFRSDIPAVLQAVDVVVQASFREGLGNSILEAMAAGRAVVASRVGGFTDLVSSGKNGVLVNPGDVPELQAALLRVMGDPDLRATLGEAARRKVEAEYRLEGEADEWCRLFQEIAQGQPEAAPLPAPGVGLR